MALIATALSVDAGAEAATLAWKGHTWQVTSGGMAGVCQGDPSNVTVDANGYLHLRISNGASGWTSSELFTADRLGFGTYQWQVDGPIDSYDKNVVLGLFPYGPAAGIGADGTNEIDIEYARWGQANGPNGDWTDYPASGTTTGELSYTFTLAPATLSTSRFVWSATSIADVLLSGLQPIDGTTGLIKSWTYAPPNPTVNVPQQALPLGMNLWCFDSPPSDGNPVEIVIRDFVFVPGGGAGATGTAGAGGAGGVGAAGAGGLGGAAGSRGGAGGNHGSGGQAGAGGAKGGSAGEAGRGAGGAGGEAGAAGPTGGRSGNGASSGGAGSGGGTTGVAGSGGGPETAGQGGATGSGAGGGSSRGCACAVSGSKTSWPTTALWLIAVLLPVASRPARARRRRRN